MATTIERLDYPIKELPSGDPLNLHAFRLRGNSPGPHVYIQSSVHGAEVQGNAVIFELLKFFKDQPFKGSITFVPLANPLAVATKTGTYTQGRFNPQTGSNYNRNYTDLTDLPREISSFSLQSFVQDKNISQSMEDKGRIANFFKEYLVTSIDEVKDGLSLRGLSEERKLGLTLQKLAATADIVLDLHTGPIATRYLYSAEYNKEKAKDLNFPFTLLIPDEFAGAMDEATFIPWIKLKDYLKERGIEWDCPFESYTVELGSEERISFKEAKSDASRLLHFLSKRGMLEENQLSEFPIESGVQYATLLKNYKTYYAPQGGLFDYQLSPGDHFKEGQVLGSFLSFKDLRELKNIDQCKTDYIAVEPGIVINHNPSAVVSEGTSLFQVFTQSYIY